MDWCLDHYWSKNQGPKQSQNRERNRNAEHYLAHLETKYGIVKTYHVYSGENQWTKRFHEKMDRKEMRKDLRPFLMYSMNKRRNWEIEDVIGVELLGEIQKLHPGEDVVFLERVACRAGYWPNLFRFEFLWEDFRINVLHELDSYVSGRPAYKKFGVNSVRGQHLANLLEYNRLAHREDAELLKKKKSEEREREKRSVVCYHLVKPPENYFTMFMKECVRKSIHPGRWRAERYWDRLRRSSSRYLDLRYDDFSEDADDSEDEETEIGYVQEERCSCYNWEHHFIDMFVHVKRKKRKKSQTRTTVSL